MVNDFLITMVPSKKSLLGIRSRPRMSHYRTAAAAVTTDDAPRSAPKTVTTSLTVKALSGKTDLPTPDHRLPDGDVENHKIAACQ